MKSLLNSSLSNELKYENVIKRLMENEICRGVALSIINSWAEIIMTPVTLQSKTNKYTVGLVEMQPPKQWLILVYELINTKPHKL